MEYNFIQNEFENEKLKIKQLLKRIDDFSLKLQSQELQFLLKNMILNLDKPFLFVVAGEVKSGKSSFVNALLGTNVCKVDIDVCTDTVQEIVYSDKESETMIEQYLKKIELNKDVLKKISIVDTPGTNSIIDSHQIITEKFIPNSDLIFFVFSAMNPHTKTAWDLLTYIKDEWKKNVVFILQKSDLLTKEELSINISKVKEYAKEKGVLEPIVYPVSAKKELNKEENSGFNDLFEFIKENSTGEKPYKMKLLSINKSILEILNRLSNDIELYKKELNVYNEVTKKIKDTLIGDEKHSKYEIESLTQRLVSSYHNVVIEFKSELKKTLSFSKFLKVAIPFNKGENIKEDLKKLEEEFKKKVIAEFKLEAKDGARYFVDGIRKLLENLIEELNKMKKTVENEDFFSKIPDNKDQTIDNIKKRLEEFLENDTFVKFLERSLPENISPEFLTEGAIAIISGIILASTNITFLDVTGGILTSLGVLISSGSLFLKRNKIIKQFNSELELIEQEFKKDISKILTEKFEVIYKSINESFVDLYEYVDLNQSKKLTLIQEFENIQKDSNQYLNSLVTKLEK